MAFAAIPNPTITTANAQTTTSTIPSNLLQYEWTQSTGDASRSFSSAGPGPNSSYIKWRTQIPKVASQPIAFSGKIFDLRGALIADLTLGPVANSLMWDGKSNGRVVPRGVYIYQIQAEGRTFSGTVVVIR